MTIGTIPITGDPAFDYFFTLVFVPGMVAVPVSILFRLFKY